MPITLGLNLSSIKAQSQLARSSSQLSSVFERLSSGQRINRASDDAAGLAIAESLNSDARVFAQGIRNLNDGLSVLNVADGALNELTNITIRLAELAEQSANGVLGKEQRAALDEEAQALSDEYFRIVQSTEFNGRQLFTANYGELRLQAGFGSDGGITEGLGGAIGTGGLEDDTSFESGLGIFSEGLVSGDFNNDGNLDYVGASAANDLIIGLGNGDGTFQSATEISPGVASNKVSLGDFNGDGNLDILSHDATGRTLSLYYGSGDGTFQDAIVSSTNYSNDSIDTTDVNNDGLIDVVLSDGGNAFEVLLGNANGTFTTSETRTSITTDQITTGDFTGDGIIDIVGFRQGGGIFLYEGDGSGEFSSPIIGVETGGVHTNYGGTAVDIDGDGNLDLVSATSSNEINIYFGSGDGTFARSTYSVNSDGLSSLVIGDLNGDQILDIVVSDGADAELTVLQGDGSRDFTTVESQSVSNFLISALQLGDYNNDGVVDLLAGGADISLHLATTADGVSPLLDFSLDSIAGAKQALSQFTQKIDQLSEQRGQIGAFQARIQVAENVLQVTTENYRAAESRIRDADIAQEAGDLVRLQILQQAGASVLGQANLQPQLVLQLLGS